MSPIESKMLSEHEDTVYTDTHWNIHTRNICVVVALLSSGQAWCAGAGGAGGSGGMQHATGALRAPPAARRGTHCLPGDSSCTGVIQQRDCSPADSCTQRYHPHISTMVRGCNMCHTLKSIHLASLKKCGSLVTWMFDPHCAEWCAIFDGRSLMWTVEPHVHTENQLFSKELCNT